MTSVMADGPTYVDLIWIEKRVQRWIRFGRVASEQIVNPRRSTVAFAPGDVFAFVRWASNDYGTVVSRIDILRAVRPGEPCSTVGFVRPGGESLLRTYGWPKVERVLQAIGLKSKLDIVRAHVAALTPRERQVFDLVIRGGTNKHVARALGCTERTIKAHRHMVMEKMQVRSLAELVSLAERIGVLASAPGQTV